MEEGDCKVLMDDGVHGNPDHAGILEGFRCDDGGQRPGRYSGRLWTGP